MYFEQFYLGCLAHASYLIGSEGVAAVVDPQRDVEIYLEAAREHGLRIGYVIETHLHADFVSGHRELAERTGAQIILGAGSGAEFPHRAARDGDGLTVGRCVLGFVQTPGHTPESISILVTDLDRSAEPYAVLTGDTLFVGDVGRPDLSLSHTPEQLAGLLYDSLFGKLLRLPDEVAIYPAHGAGSLCGRQMGTEKWSTIGRERASNHALQVGDRDDFVRRLTADLPARPEYFQRDAELNRRGAQSLGHLPPPAALPPEEVARLEAAGVTLLDTRPAIEFAAAHVPGSMHIGLSGQYASWAARLIGLDAEIVIVASGDDTVRESQVRLARVGVEKVRGYLDQGIAGWILAGRRTEYVPQIAVEELHERLTAPENGMSVVDVRNEGEWLQGYLAGAARIPLGELQGRMGQLDRTGWLAVHCRSGYRSSIATSLLRRAGFANVVNVTGGFDAWKAAKLPFVTGAAAASAD